MYTPLNNAPIGVPLILDNVTDFHLAEELRHMGIFEGSGLVRLDEEVLLQPLKVRGPRGDVVLGSGMAGKIVVHLEDGRRLPLPEMRTREHGHMEGITGGPELMHALDVLGLRRDDEVMLVRKLPPMEYIAVLEKKQRIHLTEGMAAKIWGTIDKLPMQFVSAQTGKEFHVQDLLGGKNSRQVLHGYGIGIGSILVLEKVAQAQSVVMNHIHPLIISTHDGLRMFLPENQGRRIYVTLPDAHL
jgi:Fe2+ transport system protein FeoA